MPAHEMPVPRVCGTSAPVDRALGESIIILLALLPDAHCCLDVFVGWGGLGRLASKLVHFPGG